MQHPLTACAARLVAAACASMCWFGAASAHVIDQFWAVTEDGAAQLHETPWSGSEVLARIPAGTLGLARDICQNSRSLSDASSAWCRVTYRDVEGWVERRFLVTDPTPRLPVYAPAVKPGQARYHAFRPDARLWVLTDAPFGARSRTLCRRLPDVGDAAVVKCTFPRK